MTRPLAIPVSVRKLVLLFDICSSTTILEDLIRTENQGAWQALLTKLKRFMWQLRRDVAPFEMYKFLGDGWILLFDDGAVTGAQLIEIASRLCATYHDLFDTHVATFLSGMPKHVGVTFGVDEGSLVRIVMNRREEYVGRAINVAARLQSAVKQQEGTPPGTLLITKNAFARLRLKRETELVRCKLANVAGGDDYHVHKMRVHDD
jgi:class 3 adenylate cyclase